MANLGLIDFKLGSYINGNVNSGQNKFEVQNFWASALIWHNSVILSIFDVLFSKLLGF